MTIEVWIAFVLTSSVILMVPGPTIIFVVSQSLINGRKSTVPLVAGVVTGDILCMFFSLLGLSALLALSATLFSILKFVGATYLVWLGISMLRERNNGGIENVEVNKVERNKLYRKTLTITTLNPKGIIFFSAFMPQFVNTSVSAAPQLIVLATTFLVLAFFNALLYSFLAKSVSSFFENKQHKKLFNITGGTALIGAGVVTASAKYS